MFKTKKIIIAVLAIGLLFACVEFTIAAFNPSIESTNQPSNFRYIEENLVSSSRFTQTEEVDPAKLQSYYDNFQLTLSHQEILDRNYVKSSETNDLILYYHPTSFSILIKNKHTGYVWSSRAEFIQPSESTRVKLNEMESGIWVEYVLTNNVTQRINMSNVLQERATITYQSLPNNIGFKGTLNFAGLGFRFEVSVYLEENQLVVFVDNDSIEENLPRYSLTGIQVFPFLGAARRNLYPGYFFIPDGVGALVRFQDQTNTFYQAKYYGPDLAYGITTANRYRLSMPVFGVVHEVEEDGFFAVIEQGDITANLSAYFWGYESSNYFRMAPRFLLREVFTNVIDKTGYGPAAIQSSIHPTNIQMRYFFLSHSNANYVGMANTYKNYLESKEILTRNDAITQDIGLAIDYLMNDSEPSLFGTRLVSMTKPRDVIEIYEHFKTMNITNQTVNILGWSVSGLSDTSPYVPRLQGNNRHYKELIQMVSEDNNSIYFHANYTTATSKSKRIQYTKDVARMMSKLKMDIKIPSPFSAPESIYYLYPETSYQLAKRDFSAFERLGIEKLSFSHLGHTLFGYYENNLRFNKSTSLEYYQDIASMYGPTAFYAPNAYMYSFTERILNTPIYNSQHDYFTDLVPFLSIVLAGNVELYSHYLNFNSLGIDQILNLIDFGIYPSYLLTYEETSKMRYTKSSMYYTTQYENFYDKIEEEYNLINQALRHVYGSTITNRTIHDLGIVSIDYSNGKTIWVNYTSYPYTVNDSLVISGKNYVVE